MLQDFTGVPAVVDFAAMRDAVRALGGNPEDINPQCPSDLVIDHSVQVDVSRAADSQARNEALEFERNKERFLFLKWGAQVWYISMCSALPTYKILFRHFTTCLSCPPVPALYIR